ncbi:hypothetical protein D3C81_2299390 [compost metagenome]
MMGKVAINTTMLETTPIKLDMELVTQVIVSLRNSDKRAATSESPLKKRESVGFSLNALN